MNRIAITPLITDMINQAEKELDSLKTTQLVGASSIQILNGSTGLYSFSLLAFDEVNYIVEFTANSQENALVQLSYEIFTDNSPNKDDSMFAEVYRSYDDNPLKTRWKMRIFNRYNSTKNFWVKLSYQSTDSGVLQFA